MAPPSPSEYGIPPSLPSHFPLGTHIIPFTLPSFCPPLGHHFPPLLLFFFPPSRTTRLNDHLTALLLVRHSERAWKVKRIRQLLYCATPKVTVVDVCQTHHDLLFVDIRRSHQLVSRRRIGIGVRLRCNFFYSTATKNVFLTLNKVKCRENYIECSLEHIQLLWREIGSISASIEWIIIRWRRTTILWKNWSLISTIVSIRVPIHPTEMDPAPFSCWIGPFPSRKLHWPD